MKTTGSRCVNILVYILNDTSFAQKTDCMEEEKKEEFATVVTFVTGKFYEPHEIFLVVHSSTRSWVIELIVG